MTQVPTTHREYTVLIEEGPTSYGAYIPELPGCIAAAETEEEVKKLIVEAGTMHLQMLEEAGEPIPEPLEASRVVFQVV